MLKLKVKDYIREGNILVSKIGIDNRTTSQSEYEAGLRVLLYEYLNDYEEVNLNSVLTSLKDEYIKRKAREC